MADWSSGLQLRVTAGFQHGMTLPLREKTYTLGRALRAGHEMPGFLLFLEPTLSKEHAELRWNARRKLYTVHHMSKTNATLLDGVPVNRQTPGLLTPGSKLQLGNLVVEVEPLGTAAVSERGSGVLAPAAPGAGGIAPPAARAEPVAPAPLPIFDPNPGVRLPTAAASRARLEAPAGLSPRNARLAAAVARHRAGDRSSAELDGPAANRPPVRSEDEVAMPVGRVRALPLPLPNAQEEPARGELRGDGSGEVRLDAAASVERNEERRIHLCPVCHAGFVEEDEWSAHVLAHTPGGVDFSLEEQLAVTLLALPPKLSLVLFAESDLEALRYLTLLSVELRAISPEAKEQVLRGVARCLDPELHSGEELLERLRNQPRGLAARMGLLVQSLPAHRRTPG